MDKQNMDTALTALYHLAQTIYYELPAEEDADEFEIELEQELANLINLLS